MFVCIACGYLWKEADNPPEECPACTAPKEKYIPYDDRAERWVKRAVAAHVMYPDEDGADLRAENSALSSAYQICPRRVSSVTLRKNRTLQRASVLRPGLFFIFFRLTHRFLKSPG